jgi:16S rRNA (guanine(966)-N(2))-methyltransferase RsmD
MRVIAGEFRSRRLKAVPGYDTRPTPDRLREALFNVLAPRIDGCVFLDAYAGTGAVGIEALSRGAAQAIFLEKSRGAVEIIEENVRSLGIEARCRILRGSVQLLLPRYPADIVFLDPPYDQVKEYEACLRILGDTAPSLAIVQHHAKQMLAETFGAVTRYRTLSQGDNALSFYRPDDAAR